MKKTTIILAAIVMISGCADIDKIYPAPPTIIARTEEDYTCFGGCIKNLTINSNGAVLYYERSSYGVVNRSSSVVDNAEFAELLYSYHEYFFLLDDIYPCSSGSNTTKFYFRNDTINKTVTVHGSCELAPALRALDERLNEVRDSKISYEDRNLYAVFNRTVTDIRLRLLEFLEGIGHKN